MSRTSSPLHLSPSGDELVGNADGDTLIWNAALQLWEAAPGSGGGSVTSVFGRTGAVVADPDDYAEAGSGTGYLGRYVFINAADPDVGTLNNEGCTLLAATTWTTAAQIPPGNLFEVVTWAGGGSGANGNQITTAEGAVSAPSAGGGGARIVRWFSRADLIAALPIVMTIPLRAVSASPATTAHTITLATNGSPTFFGTLVTAFGGGGGATGDNVARSGGGGGGGRGPGTIGAVGSSTGGLPTTSAGATIGLSEGGSGSTTSSAGALACGGGGAAGAAGAPTSNGAGRNGGCADLGGAGGSSSGSWATPGPAGIGGTAGVSGPSTTGTLQNGGGAAPGAVPGGAGVAGADGHHYNSGSGGSAGGTAADVAGTTGGAGGDGGNPAGGGGTGGNGRGNDGTAWAGRGGRGGRGQITVTAYL